MPQVHDLSRIVLRSGEVVELVQLDTESSLVLMGDELKQVATANLLRPCEDGIVTSTGAPCSLDAAVVQQLFECMLRLLHMPLPQSACAQLQTSHVHMQLFRSLSLLLQDATLLRCFVSTIDATRSLFTIASSSHEAAYNLNDAFVPTPALEHNLLLLRSALSQRRPSRPPQPARLNCSVKQLEQMEILESMGFNQSRAVAAMEAVEYSSIEAAVSWLDMHLHDEMDESPPPSPLEDSPRSAGASYAASYALLSLCSPLTHIVSLSHSHSCCVSVVACV